MKNPSAFSAIVLKAKDQHPWKILSLSGTDFWILGERK